MNSVKYKVLEKIEEQEISPKPKWTFQARSILLWSSIGLSVVSGGLAVSVITFLSANNDWDVIAELPDRTSFIVMTVPYAWLVATVVALAIAHHQYRQTKDAYKHRYAFTVLGLFIATGVLGAVFYNAGVGHLIEARLSRVPGYERFVNPRAGMWNVQKQGRLAGEVLELTSEDEIKVLDYTHKIWMVIIVEPDHVRNGVLVPGRRVRLIGEYLGPDEFRAMKILPWLPREQDQKRLERMRKLLPPVRQ